MNEHDYKRASLSPQPSLRSPPLPVAPARPPRSPISLTRRHTSAGSPPPNLRPPPPPPPPLPIRPYAGSLSSLQRGQNPPMTSVARSPSICIPPRAIFAVPADNPRSPRAPLIPPPIPVIPHKAPPFVYYHQPQRTQSMVATNRYSSPPPPPPPPRPPLPPHLQRFSSLPAPVHYSSPPSTPSSSRTPIAPPRPPKPPELMAGSFANSQSTSSTAIPSSDILPSASSQYAHASTAVEGNSDQLESQDKKLDAAGRSDIAEESPSYDEHDATNQLTRGGSEAQTRSHEHRSSARGSGTWEAPPPAYEESMSHEEFTAVGTSSIAATTGIEATFGRPSSPRANVQEIFLVPSPPICSVPPPTTVAESPVASSSAEPVDEITANQTDYESAGCAVNPHNVGCVCQNTENPINGGGSSQALLTPASHRKHPAIPTRVPPPVPSSEPEVTLETPSIAQPSPTRPPPIITRFQLPPSSPPPSPPSPVSSRPPSPVIFNPAALGYDPTTDTRIDPFVDVSSTPQQTTLPIVRDASMSKRAPTDQTPVAEDSSASVPRRRRMFSNTSVPGRERLSSLLNPMSSSSHSDKRPQSVVAGQSHNVDLLGSGGIILEHEWIENGGLPYSNAADGRKKRLPPTPPTTELEIRDEISIAMGGGEIIDLWHGVEFGYSSPSWDVAPGLLRLKCPPSDFPSRNTPLSLYPSPSIPFFIRAPNWRALLRLMATLNETRIEPAPEAWVDTKRGTVDLRLVLQFIRTPSLPPVGSGKTKNEGREVVLYLCLHREVPAIGSRTGKLLRAADRTKWSSWDTSTLPYGFNAAIGSRLAKETKPSDDAWMHLSSKVVAEAGTPVSEQEPDGDGSMFVTLPPPLIELPATMSDLALYLQDSLVRSRRGSKHRAMTDPKGHSEDPGKTRNVLEKANKSTTNLVVPASSRPLSTQSVTSHSRPSTSHSRKDSASTSAQRTPTPEIGVERGRGTEQRDLPIPAQEVTPERSSPPSPVTANPSPSPPLQINPALIPGIKRLATAIKSFYPGEYTPGSTQPSTGEGNGKPPSKSIFEKVKSKTSHASGALKASISRDKKRDSNNERFDLVTPWRSPGL